VAIAVILNSLLLPVRAVERAVLDGFRHVPRLDFFVLFKVGHRARYAQYPVIGPGRKPEPRDGMLHLLFRFGIEAAKPAQRARRHLRVAINAERLQPLALYCAGAKDTFAHNAGLLGFFILSEFLVFDGRDLYVQIDAVEQWTGYPRQIPLDQRRSARALMQQIAEIAALAGMRCPFAV